jgi:hypothetical protein
MVLTVVPRKVTVRSGGFEGEEGREGGRKGGRKPLLVQRGPVHFGLEEARVSFFPPSLPPSEQEEEEEEEEEEETDIFLAYIKLREVAFLPPFLPSSLGSSSSLQPYKGSNSPSLRFHMDDILIKGALLAPLPPSRPPSLPPPSPTTSVASFVSSTVTAAGRKGGREGGREGGRVFFVVEFASEEEMEEVRDFMEGKLGEHQLLQEGGREGGREGGGKKRQHCSGSPAGGVEGGREGGRERG